ncbi:Eco57I restriction-modification methylase domain-containing protein [Colwellia sp. MB3u-4]|uniref:Eco57I restriction-modification methylase domain-containing protein n=1 Tax=Colwellia sp. MB3u-4 TaxID=2759822 RepID=UPI0015F53AB4|nr:N-6 DNA methylase [Colwellia sp. MB3u-4]MBA6287759.1 N-6 DNA methylase [Colwellia sp. MB3u-4]
MYSELYKELEEKSRDCVTEEEVRLAWSNTFSKMLGIHFKAERDRNDASYNQIIIEFKNKGLFRGRAGSEKFNEAVYDRLYKYILRKSKAEGIEQGEYTGIASDGDHIVFCYMKDDKIYHQDLMPLNEVSVTKVAKALLNDTRRALTTTNLVEDFGHNSKVGTQLMGALSKELTEHFNNENNNKIKMLFEEWKTLFGQISNLSPAQIEQIKKSLKFDIPDIGENSIPGVLFIIHTYNALVMKLLGAEIVSYLNLTQYKDFCENLANQSDDNIINTLRDDIEKSRLFDNVGIKGFVEEAIFSWYLDATDKQDKKDIIEAVKEALIQISLYRMDNLSAARSRDVLKGFYQSLVPDVLRKSLGEFYTPDWLVDVTADKANVDSWLEQRVLDPTCGSGSFLLNVIARKRKEAEIKGLSSEETLDNLINNVWGFDLNPLAVQSARVNFLIAIADLFADCKGKEIELPILLADSVYSPAHLPSKDDDIVEYRIGSTHADLLIKLPSELAFDRERLDFVFEEMGRSVEKEILYKDVATKLVRRKILTLKESKEWETPLSETYNRVLELHKNNWNGIWFRIVRNFFWSATAGKFNIILGNPPWVRWSNLPEDYRKKIKPICQQYTIFSDTPFHGGNELDISGMITYTVSDKWLETSGTLIFVITQTHFQAPSSQGFRSFIINDETALVPIEVDDLKLLKPFADAANKTAIATFKKVLTKSHDGKDIYPVKYNVWENAKGFKKVIPETNSKEEVLNSVSIIPKEANPVGDLRSPWAIMLPSHFEKTEAIRGKSEWIQGRKGVTADLNGIYFLEILDVDEKNQLVLIETRPNAGKKDIGKAKRFWIEPDLLYPLVKGASDFSSCYFKPKNDLYVLVPNKGITKSYLLDAEDIVEGDLKKTHRYFESYQELLADRSTYKMRLKKYAYYMIYNVGEYTFAPYKVIWAEQSGKFEAAVVSSKEMPLKGIQPYVPDHKIYFVDCDDKNKAHYLCGLLTAPIVKEFVESHTIAIQVSNIFKHMELPVFKKSESSHKKLALIVEKAHNEADKSKRQELILKAGVLAESIIESSKK